ncbi:MAG TPA: alpha/beta hydrolase [Vicinamibacteria bacterium]|jgi:predicted alpha/beta hydrolase
MGRLLVRTEDNVAVPVRVFEAANKPWADVLVSPAAGVPQHDYSHFAQWLAQWDLRVVTYDYRGVGEARPRSLRGFPADLHGWAEDARAVVRFVCRAAGRRPLVLVGHGFGGQLLGLVDEMGWAAGLVMVSPALAQWRHWRSAERLRLLSFWYSVVPPLTRVLGYLPAWAANGADLPAGVARDWSRWARRPDSLLGGEAHVSERFRRFSAPVLAYSFTDDELVPPSAVGPLLGGLGTKRLQHRRVDPTTLGHGPIGHLGFFRPELAQTLWPELLSFVRRAVIRESRLRSAWVFPQGRAERRRSSSDARAARR